MGSRPNFFPVLKLPEKKKYPGRGPDAGGPVEPGEGLRWVYVWIFQNGERGNKTWRAAADGESPEDGQAKKDWQAATRKNNKWSVQTEMIHDSNDFETDRAATATALALVDRRDGTSDVYWWTEAVLLKSPPKRRRKPPAAKQSGAAT
jgi:hypothetical protein